MQNLKNFLIAFIAGLVVFGAFAFLIPSLIEQPAEQKVPTKQDTQTGTDASSDEPAKSPDDRPSPSADIAKSFTAVVGGYAKDGELDGLVFLKADKEHKRFLVAAIPTMLSITVTSTDPATEKTVKTPVRIKDFPKRFHGNEKVTKIVDTVHAITGIPVDYYAFFNTDTALSIFKDTGGLYFTVPQDMVYIGTGTESAPEISLKAGGQVLTAKQIVDLLRFSTYTTDEHRNDAIRASLHADFVSEAMKQIMRMDKDKIIKGLTKALGSCETNFSVTNFKDNYDLIDKMDEYAANSVVLTVDLSDPLEYTYSQKLFETFK